MKSPWKWLCENTTKPVFAAVIFLIGVVVWGGFNTAMEATNTLEFCVSCHEMKDNVYAEYVQTTHYSNRSGVRAICSDCHVPKEWGHKVIRKIRATNELFHWMIGSIDSKEKFEAKRLELAQTVWKEMKANGSHECKNCHSFDAMHWQKQNLRAMVTMQTAQLQDITCIECHKGIAHKLPDFYAHYATWTEQFNTQVAADPLSTDTVTTTAFKRLYSAPDAQSAKMLDVMPLTDFKVIGRDGEWLHLSLTAWDLNASAEIFKKEGRELEIGLLSDTALQAAQYDATYTDSETGEVWRKLTVEGWTTREHLSSDRKRVTGFVEKLWRTECNTCHNLPQPERYAAHDWLKPITAMREKSKLPNLQMTMILKYLQYGAKDMIEAN
ncbi:NapC/NirT family cytochrome c [Magnetovibrio sp.]|uniref:NapC/NirT family cytochrome c n=1 Tax=Magnetovibrio sp. TaxID=2024836 RepID=UPI002F959E05